MNIHLTDLHMHRNKYLSIILDACLKDRQVNVYLYSFIYLFMHIRIYECEFGRTSHYFNKLADSLEDLSLK